MGEEKVLALYRRCLPVLTETLFQGEEIRKAVERIINETDMAFIEKPCRKIVPKERNAVVVLRGVSGALSGGISLLFQTLKRTTDTIPTRKPMSCVKRNFSLKKMRASRKVISRLPAEIME